MIESLITSLALTLIIELLVSFLIGIRGAKNIKVLICANIITNPIVVYISNIVLLLNDKIALITSVLILEVAALICEFIIYKNFLEYKKLPPFVISMLNNMISFGVGVIITYAR